MGKLDGRVAIVTGAGQGVGRGVALALASAGARVCVSGRTPGKCESVADEIAARGGRALALGCDTTRRADVDACVARTLEEWGRLDVVVHGAQTQVYAPVRSASEDDLESMWQSGPMGGLRFMQAALPHLRETRGSVVCFGSGSSISAPPGMAGYAMAKEAIRVLVRVAAQEWGRYGVRVNAICPLASSPGLDAFDARFPGAVEQQVIPQVPLGRLGDAERDVGSGVVYLCSDDAAYVSGTTLMVDGGYTYLR